MEALEELDLARSCLLGGLTLTLVGSFMMPFYIAIPYDVNDLQAWIGVGIVFLPSFALLSRILPR
jgi:hypothetical protein